MKTLAMCVAVSGLVGCASPHGLHYTLLLDTSLAPDQVEQVMQSGQAWETAIPFLRLDYQVTSCHNWLYREHTVCLFWDTGSPPEDPVYHVLPEATTNWDNLESYDAVGADSATIHLWQQVLIHHETTYNFRNVVSHELGHAFTHRSSHLPSGHLMSAMAQGKVLEQITPGDTDYFWSVR